MFQNLKVKNNKKSVFKNMAFITKASHAFNRSPGATSSSVKGNEKDRLVRCRHCGFICDTDRDINYPDGTYAGYGINQGVQLTAGSCKADKRTPAAGAVAQTPDKYYNRDVQAGCPSCGSLVFHPRQMIIKVT